MGRRLGQHFLADPAILDRIVDALDPQSDDVVIEVGPGKGSLTRRLVTRVGRVVAIERDVGLAAALSAGGTVNGERGTVDSLRVVQGDAREIDWHSELNRFTNHKSQIVDRQSQISVPPSPFTVPPEPWTPEGTWKVVGNIPYYITSPLIDKALTPPRPQVIVFLIQREVADRLVAPPGGKTYGALTVGVQAVAQVERLFIVRPGSFNPAPKVDSAVVRITPREDPLVADAEVAGFRQFTTALFSQRRKQLKRVLRSVAKVGAGEVEAKLAELDLDPMARPENLEPEAIVRLYRSLS